MRGLFITFEGPDGSGKSTQVELLARALAHRRPLVVREPGGTPLGEKIRELLLLRPEGMSGMAEMYLFMAARAELLETRIRPALAKGRVVIDDRYQDSTIAYQGGGRGVEPGWPAHFPKPDLTVLLALPPEEGISRIRRSEKALDRLDSESLPFHLAVASAYDRLAESEPARFLRVEARAMPGDIHVQVMKRVETLLVKLIVAVVQGEDAPQTVQALSAAGISVTKLASSGGFLQQGNSTLMIGVDNDRVESALEVIRENCRERSRYMTPMPPMVEPGEFFMPYPVEVQVGGATVFVVDVIRFEKL